MTAEELIKKASEWLYYTLKTSDLNMSEEDIRWWVKDLVEYMEN